MIIDTIEIVLIIGEAVGYILNNSTAKELYNNYKEKGMRGFPKSNEQFNWDEDIEYSGIESIENNITYKLSMNSKNDPLGYVEIYESNNSKHNSVGIHLEFTNKEQIINEKIGIIVVDNYLKLINNFFYKLYNEKLITKKSFLSKYKPTEKKYQDGTIEMNYKVENVLEVNITKKYYGFETGIYGTNSGLDIYLSSGSFF